MLRSAVLVAPQGFILAENKRDVDFFHSRTPMDTLPKIALTRRFFGAGPRSMSAGAKLGHSAPRERRSAAE